MSRCGPKSGNYYQEVTTHATKPWTRVAASSGVVAERPFGLSLGGIELVLVRTPGGIRAYEGRCPHQGALLAEGQLGGGVLNCRNHGWRFDAESGRRLDGVECLRACEVREADGAIWANTLDLAAPADHPDQPVARRRIDELPGPRGLPLLGNILQIDLRKFHAILEQWAVTYGPVYRLRLGPRRAIVVSGRMAADRALRARPDTYRRLRTFESVAAELGMIGVFTAEGETWRPLRKLAVNALSEPHLRGFYDILRTVAERVQGRWRHAAKSGHVLDVADEFKRFAVDITTWLALGRDVNTVEGRSDVIERHVGVIFPMFHRRVVSTVPYWRFLRLPSDRRFERALAEVRAWIDQVIADTRARLAAEPARAETPTNFLEAMLVERDEAGRPFSDEALFGSAMTMLIAGQDTTSTSLAWTVHHLCRNPTALDRLRGEVDDVLGRTVVPQTVEQAQRLTYTAAAVNEAMRLSPVVPVLYLETNVDTVVDDVAVPRGTPIFLLTRPSMRHGQFDAPDEFRPERWLDGGRGSCAHDPRAHIPFGSGPRLCPGRSLAMLEARVALATLVRSFDIERDTDHVAECYTSLMVPGGLSARLRARAPH